MKRMIFVAVAACGPKNDVSPVAGREWPIESAFLTASPETFGADDLVTVTLSSLPDSCDLERVYRAAVADAETPTELADAWSSSFPEAFVEVQLAARLPGGTWPPERSLWSGLAWDELPDRNNVVWAVLTDHVAPRDETYWSGDFDDEDDYEHVFYSDGGLVKWGKAEPSLRLSGRFNADVRDGSGNDAGTTEVQFDATVCGL